MKLGLEPEWVEDLLGLWAAADLGAVRGRLGHDSCSPMFRMLGAVSGGHDDTDDSYSNAELQALRTAVEQLQHDDDEAWQAVMRAFRPWALGAPSVAEHMQALQRAATRLAAAVDKEIG